MAKFITEILFADAQLRIGGRFCDQLYEVAMNDKSSLQPYDSPVHRLRRNYHHYIITDQLRRNCKEKELS
jgi:hypothetical protein